MRKPVVACVCLFVAVSFGFAGGQKDGTNTGSTATNVQRTLAPGAVLAGPVVASEVLPDGTKGMGADTLTLTSAEEAKIKSGNYTAAIVLQVLDSSWAQQQIAGMKSVFDAYKVNVVSVTGANAKPEVQMALIESVIAKRPNAILSIPVDPTATGPAYKRVKENGIELVLLDMIPEGLKHKQDYSSLISSSSYGNGVSAADIMADEFIKMGKSDAKVSVMKLNFSHFVTEERVRGFKERVAQFYPWIKIVAEVDFPYDMPKVNEISAGMLTANPGLDGSFVIWMTPAMSLVTAAREAGLDPKKFVITTVDLEEDGAMEIASNGYIKGTGAQDPYQNGRAEAFAAMRAMIGKDNPAYVAVPGYAVTRKNIVEGYKAILGEDAPNQIKTAASK